ncbi:cortistatin isoform X1 [Rissa tridactyla]|uniref:cortistatin isoform X1 n=1 Tax=Rissa tridactyla TaxID=75485 RepID=UPI0023BA8C67|nr:cortistatin isoform X1 [Rissa tridactyla]
MGDRRRRSDLCRHQFLSSADGKSITSKDRALGEAGNREWTPQGMFCLHGCGLQGLHSSLFPALCPQEQSTVRKDAILKMLAGLLDSVDVGHEAASPDLEEEGKLEEERAVLGRLAQLSQRDRKAPCKNFFWKTFTSSLTS